MRRSLLSPHSSSFDFLPPSRSAPQDDQIDQFRYSPFSKPYLSNNNNGTQEAKNPVALLSRIRELSELIIKIAKQFELEPMTPSDQNQQFLFSVALTLLKNVDELNPLNQDVPVVVNNQDPTPPILAPVPIIQKSPSAPSQNVLLTSSLPPSSLPQTSSASKKITKPKVEKTEKTEKTEKSDKSEKSPNSSKKDKSPTKRKIKYKPGLRCLSCGTTETPEWRKGPQGSNTLCNACGIRWSKKIRAEKNNMNMPQKNNNNNNTPSTDQPVLQQVGENSSSSSSSLASLATSQDPQCSYPGSNNSEVGKMEDS